MKKIILFLLICLISSIAKPQQQKFEWDVKGERTPVRWRLHFKPLSPHIILKQFRDTLGIGFDTTLAMTWTGLHTFRDSIKVGNDWIKGAGGFTAGRGIQKIAPDTAKLDTTGSYTWTGTGNTFLNSVYMATSSGKVGIGTASPVTLLEVEKNQNLPTTIRIENPNTLGASKVQFQLQSETAEGFFDAFSDGHSSMTGVGGKVGLRTVIGNGLFLQYPFSGTFQIYQYNLGVDVGLERMRINSSGRFGFLTTPHADREFKFNGDIDATNDGDTAFVGTIKPTTTIARVDIPSQIAYEDEANAFTLKNTFADTLRGKYLVAHGNIFVNYAPDTSIGKVYFFDAGSKTSEFIGFDTVNANNYFTISDALVPTTNGTGLGLTGSRWDAFIGDLDVNGTFTGNVIDSGNIITGAIKSSEIFDNTIDSNDIKNEAVTTFEIKNATVDSLDVATRGIDDKNIVLGGKKISAATPTEGQVLGYNATQDSLKWLNPTSNVITLSSTYTLTLTEALVNNLKFQVPLSGTYYITMQGDWFIEMLNSQTSQFYGVIRIRPYQWDSGLGWSGLDEGRQPIGYGNWDNPAPNDTTGINFNSQISWIISGLDAGDSIAIYGLYAGSTVVFDAKIRQIVPWNVTKLSYYRLR